MVETLRISALGLYCAFINGVRVGDDLVGFSAYEVCDDLGRAPCGPRRSFRTVGVMCAGVSWEGG